MLLHSSLPVIFPSKLTSMNEFYPKNIIKDQFQEGEKKDLKSKGKSEGANPSITEGYQLYRNDLDESLPRKI